MVRKNNKEEIKEYFFLHPTEKLRARQIERKAEVSIPSVLRYVKELEEEDILKKEEVANMTVYSADRTSRDFLLEKKLFNMKMIHDSGLLDHLVEEYDNAPMILFGSYSRGEDVEDSDIDIYVETPEEAGNVPEKFEEALKRSVQLFCFETIHAVDNKELANNMMNGTTLNGFVKVFE